MVRLVFWCSPRFREEGDAINASTELFLDLVFAQAIRSLRFLAFNGMSVLPSMIDFSILYFPFWWMAFVTMQYENRFTWDDNVTYRFYLVIQMIVTTIMMVNSCDCSESDSYSPEDGVMGVHEDTLAPTPVPGNGTKPWQYYCSSALRSKTSSQYAVFAIATATNQMLAACNYFQAGVTIRIARRWCTAYMCGLTLSSVLFLLPILPAVESYRVHMRYVCTTLAHLCCITFEFMANTPSVQLDGVMVADSNRRIMKFTTVVLAQSVLAVISPGSIYTFTSYVTCAAILITAFLFKTLHFDFDHGHKAVGFRKAYVPCMGRAYRIVVSKMLWIMSQLGLAMGLTVFGTSAELMVLTFVEGKASKAIRDDRDVEAKRHFGFWAWMLPASFSWVIMMTIINQSALVGEGRGVRQWRKRWRLGARAVLGMMALILPFLSALQDSAYIKFFPKQYEDTKTSVISLTWTCAVLMAIIVCVDAYGRRRKEHHPESMRRYLFGHSLRPEKDEDCRGQSSDLLLLSHEHDRDRDAKAKACSPQKGSKAKAASPQHQSQRLHSFTLGVSEALHPRNTSQTFECSTELLNQDECSGWENGQEGSIVNRSMGNAA
jgi:hypothetical protein